MAVAVSLPLGSFHLQTQKQAVSGSMNLVAQSLYSKHIWMHEGSCTIKGEKMVHENDMAEKNGL